MSASPSCPCRLLPWLPGRLCSGRRYACRLGRGWPVHTILARGWVGLMRKAGWACGEGWVGAGGRLGGHGRLGLGSQPREGPLQWSVWTWGLCLAFSARWPAYPEPFPDSLSVGPWEGLCPPGCPDPLHPGGGRLGARNDGGELAPHVHTYDFTGTPEKTEHFAKMKGK